MKILLAALLLVCSLAVKVNSSPLSQAISFYAVPYELVNGIAMANFSFPSTIVNNSAQVMIDLQQGFPSAWNCTGTPICDAYNLISPNFTVVP